MSNPEQVCASPIVAASIADYRERASRLAGLRSFESACVLLGASLRAALAAAFASLNGRAPRVATTEEMVVAAREIGLLPPSHPLGAASDPIAMLMRHQPAEASVSDDSLRQVLAVPFPRNGPFHSAVTEDDYLTCERYLADALDRLAAAVAARTAGTADARDAPAAAPRAVPAPREEIPEREADLIL